MCFCRMRFRTNLSGEGTVRMLVCFCFLGFWVVRGLTFIFFLDPVMAEYITIMLINNKTAGAYYLKFFVRVCRSSLTNINFRPNYCGVAGP